MKWLLILTIYASAPSADSAGTLKIIKLTHDLPSYEECIRQGELKRNEFALRNRHQTNMSFSIECKQTN